MKQLSLFAALLMVTTCGRSPESDIKSFDDVKSIDLRTDGRYDVVCKDGTKEVTTKEKILAGDVCESANNSFIISAGVYKIVGGDSLGGDCLQLIKTFYSGSTLRKVRIFFEGTCSSYPKTVLKCSRNECLGNNQMKIILLDNTHYRFIYKAKTSRLKFSGNDQSSPLNFSVNGVRFEFSRIMRSQIPSNCSTKEVGCFLMGTPTSESGRDKDELQHEVLLTKDFYMQATEVTRAQFKAVMGQYPEQMRGSCTPELKNDAAPAACASFDLVLRFVKELNTKMKTNTFRIPTEAQWEYAARCGSTEPYVKKGVNRSNLDKAKIAWYYRITRLPHPVKQLSKNNCGLYDTLGNVYEWVADKYQKAYPRGRVTDPLVTGGTKQGARGGSYRSNDRQVRVGYRYLNQYGKAHREIGFRLLRSIK